MIIRQSLALSLRCGTSPVLPLTIRPRGFILSGASLSLAKALYRLGSAVAPRHALRRAYCVGCSPPRCLIRRAFPFAPPLPTDPRTAQDDLPSRNGGPAFVIYRAARSPHALSFALFPTG